MNHCDYCAQFISPSGTVLDVGSGRGKFICEMAKRGFQATGIEINREYINESQAKVDSENVEVSVIQASVEQLPFNDGQFDFVNCAEVIEHVEDPAKVCQEIYRVLKTNAKSYISFHNRWGICDYHYHLYFINWLPRSWAEFILKLLKKQKEDSITGRQRLTTMHYYTYSQATYLLKKIGFLIKDIRVEKIKRKYGKLSLFFLLLYRLLRPFYFNTFHLLVEKYE